MLRYLFIILFLTSIHSASAWRQEDVETQLAAWRKIHAVKRGISGFSNTATNFPPVLDRITYMARYVRNAIAGLKDRESAVDEIMQEAESLLEQEKLTFHTATRLFGSLAITCDKTELLRTDEEGAPAYALDGRNRCYLCVPKGGLKLSRIVDGYLRPIPEVYMAL